MSTLGLSFHSKRSRFNRTGEAQKKASRECNHKDDIEDNSNNYKDEFEIINKFSRMPFNLIRLYNIKVILDQIDDDGDVIQGHDYKVVNHKLVGEIDWLEDENIELEQVMA